MNPRVFALSLILVGLAGMILAAAQCVKAHHAAVIADLQERYRHGFEMLASAESGTRIGGLFVLQRLLQEDDLNGSAGGSAGRTKSRQNTIRQSIAAFAVDHSLTKRPGSDDPVVSEDALVALRIIGESESAGGELPVNLREGYFFGSFLPGAHLEHVDLYGANLAGADIHQGHLSDANLRKVDFDGANLAGADFSHAGFLYTTFCPAKNFATPELMRDERVSTQMNGANFHEARGFNVYFNGATLEKAIFDDSQFTNVSFVDAELSDARFLAVTFEEADFTNSQLQRANFSRDLDKPARINGAKFDDSDLSSADFDYAQLGSVSFRNSNLRGATFRHAVLNGADLSGANLADANFEGASLAKGNFNGALLRNTRFGDAKFDRQMLAAAVDCSGAKAIGTVVSERCTSLQNFSTPAPTPLTQHCMLSAVVRPAPGDYRPH